MLTPPSLADLHASIIVFSNTRHLKPDILLIYYVLIRVRVLSGRLVVVIVGADRVEWSLQENLLCNFSDFFTKALRGEFRESKGTIELPEDDPSTFAALVRWAYAVTIGVDEPQMMLASLGIKTLLNLYVFAYKYMNITLQDMTITIIHRRTKSKICWSDGLDFDDIAAVFAETQESSQLRSLLIKWVVWDFLNEYSIGIDPEWKEFLDDRPDEVKSAILKELVLWKKNHHSNRVVTVPLVEDSMGQPCDFHLHGSEQSCPVRLNTRFIVENDSGNNSSGVAAPQRNEKLGAGMPGWGSAPPILDLI